MSPIRTVVVENEQAALAQLQDYLVRYFPTAQVLGQAANIEDGIKLIKHAKPQLVLLDVELDDGLSFSILEAFPEANFLVVFCTAFEHYALRAIQLSALDYLLKPLVPDVFQTMVQKIEKRVYEQAFYQQQARLLSNLQVDQSKRRIALRDAQHIYFVAPEQLLYCQAEGRYTHFYANSLPNGKVIISQHLRLYEELLKQWSFYRCHHSYLVNLREITRINKAEGTITLSNNAQIPLSHRKREGLLQAMASISTSG